MPYNKQLNNLDRSVVTGKSQISTYCIDREISRPQLNVRQPNVKFEKENSQQPPGGGKMRDPGNEVDSVQWLSQSDNRICIILLIWPGQRIV